jgi:hypothetical protein
MEQKIYLNGKYTILQLINILHSAIGKLIMNKLTDLSEVKNKNGHYGVLVKKDTTIEF